MKNRNVREIDEQGRLKKWLTTEVKFIIGIVTIVLGVVAPYYQMQTHLALIDASISNINENHEVHIQDIDQNLLTLTTTETAQQKEISTLQNELIGILGK